MEAQLTMERLLELKQVFSYVDKNRDEHLSVFELGHALRSIGENWSEDDLRRMVAEIDTEDKGSINFQEFLDVMTNNQSYSEEEILQAFRELDQTGQGYMLTVRLRQALTQVGEVLPGSEADTLLGEADPRGTGMFNYQDFITSFTML